MHNKNIILKFLSKFSVFFYKLNTVNPHILRPIYNKIQKTDFFLNKSPFLPKNFFYWGLEQR